tara:strand:+ start:2879 stop:3229 length:351 start_codon:yes stop_codon:yes gene_type:complete
VILQAKPLLQGLPWLWPVVYLVADYAGFTLVAAADFGGEHLLLVLPTGAKGRAFFGAVPVLKGAMLVVCKALACEVNAADAGFGHLHAAGVDRGHRSPPGCARLNLILRTARAHAG